MTSALETLLAAATRAPSGDNTQPWHWEMDPAEGRLTLRLDPTRDPSPMNAGQRMARIALGAALENVWRTARFNGWDLAAEAPPPSAVAALHLRAASGRGQVEPSVLARVTNRRLYDARPLATDVRGRLEAATPALDGVRTAWIHDRARLTALADLAATADVTMFGEPSMRRAFLTNVRFDAPARAAVSLGLSLGSLELSAADCIALRLLKRLPDWVVRTTGAVRGIAAHSRRLVASASGACLITALGSAAETDVAVGRAAQRAWLALTALGLAGQPMMSALVLDNALEHGSSALRNALGVAKLESMQAALRAWAPEIGAGRPAFLLRFGYAPPPTGRTGRQPLAAVTSPASTSPTCGAEQALLHLERTALCPASLHS